MGEVAQEQSFEETRQPVLWWRLINEAEWLTATIGWGLTSVWQHINQNDYERARLKLDRCLDSYHDFIRTSGREPVCYRPRPLARFSAEFEMKVTK